MKRRVAAKLPPQAAERTLLEYLSCRFAYHTSEEWQDIIQSGKIALDGAVCTVTQAPLRAGMLLEYFPGELSEPSVNRAYHIVFEDEYLLVIDKPGNLPVHPAGPYFNHTLWALLAENGYEKIHFVNRLDRETSGLLIAAKTGKIAGILSKTLADMEKCYHAVVHGTFPAQIHASGFLVPDAASGIKKKLKFVTDAENTPGAMAVETTFELLAGNRNFSLLAAKLHTGRMHQIRATLQGLGYPVAGDKLYGLDEQLYRRFALGTLSGDDRKKLILERQALHCCKLSFIHPVSGEIISFSSPTPPEMTALI